MCIEVDGVNFLCLDVCVADVRLKEFGSDSVDVSDNGTGVEEKNFCVLSEQGFLISYSNVIAEFFIQ